MKRERTSQKWLTMIAVIVGTFVVVLNTSSVIVGLPSLMHAFNATELEIQWVITGFMITMGVIIPVSGYLGDRWGTKKVFLGALGIFIVGSALSSLSWSTLSLVLFRMLQGTGGGMVIPLGMTIIYNTVRVDERGFALGIWGLAIMIAPTIGPTLSGYLIEIWDWRVIFSFNVPLGIIALVLAAFLLKESELKPKLPFDGLGFLLIAVGSASFLLALNEGSTYGWASLPILALLITSALGFGLFIRRQLKIPYPLLDLKVFSSIIFTYSLLISVITTIGLFAGAFMMPLYLQNVLNRTPIETGLILFPGALFMGICQPIGGKLFDRYGARGVVFAGLAVITLTTYALHNLNLNTDYRYLSLLLAIRGAGIGLSNIPATTAGLNTVPLSLIGRASALSNTIRQVSGALGIALMAAMVEYRQADHLVRMASGIESSAVGVEISAQATAAAMGDAFLILAIFSVVAIPMVYFLKAGKPESLTASKTASG
ncbi:MAG: DHA2 family efflux MFS transporter permease subunit [Bacillota bacterium]